MNLSLLSLNKKRSFSIRISLVFLALLITTNFSLAQEVNQQRVIKPMIPRPQVTSTAGDLTIQIVQCPRTSVKAGEELRAGFKVVGNSTFANAVNNVVVDIILTSHNTYPMPAPIAVYSPNYSDNVLLLGGREHISFPGAGSVAVILNGNNTIPADTPPGIYYLAAVIDAGNTVAEINERNNVSFCKIQVVGTGVGNQKPDLTIPSLAFKKVEKKTDASGKPYWIFNVIITVKNQGPVAAGPFNVLLERNVGAGGAYTNACPTCIIAVPGLAAGQSIILPPRQFNNSGNANSLFRATADNGGSVAESNESNNMNAENFSAN